MHLADFLKAKGLTQSAFGQMLEPPVSQGLVSQWLVGKVRMTLDQALKTKQLSSGLVTPEDCAALFGGAADREGAQS